MLYLAPRESCAIHKMGLVRLAGVMDKMTRPPTFIDRGESPTGTNGS